MDNEVSKKINFALGILIYFYQYLNFPNLEIFFFFILDNQSDQNNWLAMINVAVKDAAIDNIMSLIYYTLYLLIFKYITYSKWIEIF